MPKGTNIGLANVFWPEKRPGKILVAKLVLSNGFPKNVHLIKQKKERKKGIKNGEDISKSKNLHY